MAHPNHLTEAIVDLASELDVPETRYEQAEKSYRALGHWLVRPESTLKGAQPKVYVQGSFALGTAIRPMSDAEDYDVDIVCEMSIEKQATTQADLKRALGSEIVAYAKAHNMARPEEGRRCWTLSYADGAQFHMDTLPSITDGRGKRLLLEGRGLDATWAANAIAITDRNDPNYTRRTPHWPHSNPKGYAAWFRTRMAAVFDARRGRIALQERKRVEDIPDYRVRTPLQMAVQVLKRHRDRMFAERSDDKPISIILTTLAAHAYGMEVELPDALSAILNSMDRFIEDRNGVSWVPNPTDASENFADRWEEFPARRTAFHEWLSVARADFATAVAAKDRDEVAAALVSGFGLDLVQKALKQRGGRSVAAGPGGLQRFVQRLRPSHKQDPPWRLVEQGRVVIRRAEMERSGFRPREFGSDAPALPKHVSLLFEAATTVPKPYDVYWQVVNTGTEAHAAGGLRGGFDVGQISAGRLTRKEKTLYSGTHSIECFIVRSGLLAARSGQFIVNIS